MIFDYSLAALVAAGLLCFLMYALLRPERFKRRFGFVRMPTWSQRALS